MKSKLSRDINQLTSIPISALDSLSEKSEWCICNTLQEAVLNDETEAEIDLGIGSLLLSIQEGKVLYKFIPSKSLEKSIFQTYTNKQNPLVQKIEETLVKKITEVYKDLL